MPQNHSGLLAKLRRKIHPGPAGTIDPRGEFWCIAARRRRELGRRAVLIDPFSTARAHKEQFPECYLPDVASASYNPLQFVRDDDSLADRDINVLFDALLTPPRPDAHQNGRHFYQSARAIVAGYMAWVRFKEPPERGTLARLREMLSAAPEARAGFAAAFRNEAPFAGGLASLAVERQAQVGKEEGGSTFTTIANQLAFLNYPELIAHTRTSSFDPLVLAEGDTELFVVAPEETVEHVKGWLRLWIVACLSRSHIHPLDIGCVSSMDRDSWTFTTAPTCNSLSPFPSFSGFFQMTRPVPPTWKGLAGAMGSPARTAASWANLTASPRGRVC